MLRSLVGSEMCIRDRFDVLLHFLQKILRSQQKITLQIQLCIQTISFYAMGGVGDVLPYYIIKVENKIIVRRQNNVDFWS